jgi:hypothetical protein
LRGPLALRAAGSLLACVLVVALVCGASPVLGEGVDGISDQSLPAWDGAFVASPLAGWVAQLAGGPDPRLRLARYVVQWNAMSEASGGPSPHGDYRERFEAWLADVRGLRQVPVLAPTSFDASRPQDVAVYVGALQALLARARAAGLPIGYLEPWNEPNDQGREAPALAAEQADAAAAMCAAAGCTVIAGDLQDGPGMVSYERAYERALSFHPTAWGIHPYHALAERSEAPLEAFRAALPGGGAGAQLWATEAGAFYCRHGRVSGEAAQAAEAAYLADVVAAPGAPVPLEHVFYYGLSAADGAPAACTAAGGTDSELFGPGDRPRPAAGAVLDQAAGGGWPLIGPLPGQDPLAFAALTEG